VKFSSQNVQFCFAYFAYSTSPEVPRLSGTMTRGTVTVGGLQRTYRTYVPRELAKGAPLVVVMHGAGENGARIRIETGYGFERLADEHGFAVVYPNAYEGYWDVCNIVGDVSANGLTIDDVGFLTGMVDKLVGEIGVDPGRVFAAGSSRGGFMAYRLALEAPSRFRAVAAVSANVPSPENFKCKPAGQGTSSVMIMNGTKDPLVPFDGGSVSLFGLFYKMARSGHRGSRASILRTSTISPAHRKGTRPRRPMEFAWNRCSGATTPTWRWSWLPFTAVDMASLSRTGGIQGV
jgi:polyhydroxybutyrate depolymerase